MARRISTSDESISQITSVRPQLGTAHEGAAAAATQAEKAKTLVHPAGEVDVNGKTTYYGKGANKDGTWDGTQFQPTKETKLYFDIMKEMMR